MRHDPGSYPEVHPRSECSGTQGPITGGATIVFLHGGNVANWMWDPQVRALADFRVLTPHLPGFGGKAGEDWVSLESTADAMAAFITSHAGPGPVHVVGLSLGAVVALHLAARHPELASSVLVSGAVVARVGGLSRSLAALQFAFWDKAWFWRAQAKAFGLPADSVEPYVQHGLTLRRENVERMLQQVYAGQMPVGVERFGNRVLAVAGEKEPGLAANSLRLLAARLPVGEFRMAPGMHHVWNVENEPLFTAMVRQWAAGTVHPGLVPAQPGPAQPAAV